MPTYSIKGVDGKTYSIKGPEGLSEAQVISAIQSELRREEDQRLQSDLEEKQRAAIAALYGQQEEEDAGFFENIATGFGAGAVDVGELAALGGAALLDEEAELATRKRIQSVADALRPEGGDEESITYNLSKALGSIAGVAAPAALAAAAAPAALTTAVGTGIAGLLSVGAGAGEASERARAAGATEEERGRAALIGAPIGALEILPLGRALKFIDIPVFTKFIDQLGPDPVQGFTDYLKNAGLTGALEAGQEGTSAILQNLNERGYNKEAEIIGDALVEAGYGGGAGAILQLLVDGKRGISRARAKKAAEGGGEPTPEEIQGELFEGEDLGTAPVQPAPTPAQEELFPDTDLGRAPERAGDPDQLDLFAPRAPQPEAVQPDMVEEAESAQLREIIDADETAQIQAMLDADAKAEAELRQEQETRAASETETIAGRLDTQQQQATEQRRTAILQDVIENTPTRQEDTLTKNFSRALETAGIANTQPNQSETRVIKRAIDVQRAERPAPVEEPEVKPKQFQVVDGKRVPRTEVPFVPERLTAAQTRKVTPEDMDKLAIKPASPLRNRIKDKDVTTPEVQRQLREHAANPKVSPETKEKINEQLDLFAPRGDVRQDQQRPVRARDDAGTDRASFTPAGQPRVGSPDTARTPAPTERGLGDTGVSPARPTRRTAGRTTPLEPITPTAIPAVEPIAEIAPQAAPQAVTKAAPREDIREVARRLGMTITPAQARDLDEQRRTKDLTDEQLEAQIFQEGDERETARLEKEFDETVAPPKKRVAKKAAPKKAARKKAVPKKVSAEKKEEIKKEVRNKIKKDADKAVAAVPEETREESRQLEFYTKKFGDAPKVSFVDKDGDPVVESLDIETTKEDDVKILELIKTKIPEQQSEKKGTETSERKEARAAKLYFEKQENPNDALEVITHEATFSTTQFRATKDMGDGEVAYFAGTGPDAAKMALRWVRKNLSKSTNKSVTNLIAYQTESLRSANRRAESLKSKKNDPVTIEREQQAAKDLDNALEAQQNLLDQGATFKDEELFETQEAIDDYLPTLLREDAVVGLDIPTHPVIGNLLRQGKLVEALRALQATSPSSRVSQLAGALAKVTGDTKVEIKQFVTDEAGNPVAGKFDPVTNTITLNAETGINPHTLLHEMTHAATSQTLANKSHPLTKQLTKLFNDVKDSLDTAYGSQSVDEFVAEAFSNPEFQQTLGQINVKGEPISALQRFFNSVANVLRRAMGMQTKPVDSALNQTDQLIEAMLAPAPESRNAGKLYMQAMVPARAKALIDNMVKNTPTWDAAGVKRVKQILEDRFPDPAKNFVLGMLPINALVGVAKARIPMAAKLEQLTFEASGKITEMNNIIEPVVKRVSAWGSKNPDKLDAFNDT
jgi:hypothetical protein